MKEYNVLSNYKYGTKIYEEYIGRRYHLQNISDILLGILSPFIAMLFPGVVVSLFQTECSVAKLLIFILAYALGIAVLDLVGQKLANRTTGNYFLARVYAATPIYEHMIDMDYEKFVSKEGDDLANKAVRCVLSGNNVGIESFLKSVPAIIKYAIGCILYSIIVAKSSHIILLYLLISTIIYFGIMMCCEKSGDKRYDILHGLYIKQKSVLAETLEDNAQADIMLYQAKELLERQFCDIREEQKKATKHYLKLFFYDGNVEGIVTFLRDLLAYVYLIVMLKNGSISISELLIFVGAISGFGFWMKGGLKELVNLFVQNRYMTDYRNFLEYGCEKDVNKHIVGKGNPHEIEFRSVSYEYEAGKKVLDNVSFIIHAGEKIALVGENGAGKTTIVKLLLGLLHPTSGEILIDGVNTEAFSRREYFEEFSAVFQDSFVLAGTVGVNVAGRAEYDRTRVENALQQAGLMDRVERLQSGIDTELTQNISEEGIVLSGGETQKLMLARAIYSQAPVLILDEPTSALDPLAESKMYESYSDLCNGRSSLFISHRLASTRFCDCIYFLEHGRIAERGTHEELLKAGKKYADMFGVQAKYYKEE